MLLKEMSDELERYLGVKIIHATPMTAQEFNESVRPFRYPFEDQNGYKVVYEDGYESWSPKDAFEKAYRKTKGVTFGMALEAAKKGMGFRLPQWSPDVVIRAQLPDEYSKMTAPYLYVQSRFGRVPWKEIMIELFSDNWEIVE